MWDLMYQFLIIADLLTLEIQHPNFENSRLGLIVSIHERYWQKRHPSRRLAPG